MPSYQRLKTMIRRHVDQMTRTRNFRARNERIEAGVSVKSQYGKHISMERRMGSMLSVESKRTVFKWRLLELSPRKWSWTTKRAQSSFFVPKAQRQIDGRKPSLNRDANSATKCFFKHVEADGQPSKKLKKGGAKGSVACRSPYNWVACLKILIREESILRNEGKLGSNRAVTFSKGTWHHIHCREKGSIARSKTKMRNSRTQSVCAKI